MRSVKIIALSALAAVGLSACNNSDGRGRAAGDKGICTPFVEMPTQAAAAPGLPPAVDPAAAVDDCLHRWAYSLAAGSDTAEVVAQATLAACTPALSRWNQQSLTVGAATGAERAPSLMTGQPTTPFQEHLGYAQGRALFYVVQARAGKCAPPPPPAAAQR